MKFPTSVPEIPVASIEKATEYYVYSLGFTLDWGDEQGRIAGISKDDCRLFLTNHKFRESIGNTTPIVIWINLESKSEVDELYLHWKKTQAKILAEPEDKPWKLREFLCADLDGNHIRVFYDFSRDI